MTTVTLPPDLQLYAAEAVAAGRYRDVAEVVATGVAMLRRQEDVGARFVELLLSPEAEADVRIGGDEMIAHVRTRLGASSGANG